MRPFIFCCFLSVIVFASTSALSLGSFSKIADGIYDAWNTANPENVQGGNFVVRVGGGKLWVVSRRQHRSGSSDPWDPALRGGIVSTLSLSGKTWTHKPYDRVDVDTRGEKIFVASNRLFMITYAEESREIVLKKLFVWNDEQGRWQEIPLEIQSSSTQTARTGTITAIDVVVPKSDGRVAYIATSSHGQARPGSDMVFLKLELEVSGNALPTKATVKTLVQKNVSEPSAVQFLVTKNDKLLAFVANFYSEGYVSSYDKAYAIDVTSNQLSTVQVSGSVPDVASNTNENAFQTDDTAFITGGTVAFGLGQLRRSNEIWALNLNNMQWSKSSSAMPDNAGGLAFDKVEKKLYAVSLREGVKITQLAE